MMTVDMMTTWSMIIATTTTTNSAATMQIVSSPFHYDPIYHALSSFFITTSPPSSSSPIRADAGHSSSFSSIFDTHPQCITFLFRDWSLHSEMKFLLACIACLAMGITNEALTSTRRRLRNSPYENACCKQTCCMLCLCKRLLPVHATIA